MKTLLSPSKLLKTLALAALLVPFACMADDVEKEAPEPVGRDAVIVQKEDGVAADEADPAPAQLEKTESDESKEADPGWIGDCYYYADGGCYNPDGIYWRPDLKTYYVYDEECWHLPNGGILTRSGVYYPPIASPDGYLGIPWRLAAVTVSLLAGPPWNPGVPPEKPTRVIIEVRSSSGR